MRKILGIMMLSLMTFAAGAQTGRIKEGLSFESKTLKSKVNYAVYLPYNSDPSLRSYPVVFLLHGYSDNETGWIQYGEIDRIMNEGIINGTIPPMIIVMPDAKVTWYSNDYKGQIRFEDMFIQEFIPYIDATFPTRPTKEFRAVAGLSMGGYGAMLYGLKHPELFTACAGLSAAILTQEEMKTRLSDDGFNLQNIYGPMVGDSLPSSWYHNSIIDIVKNCDAKTYKNLGIWLDCGDDDFLIKGNLSLQIALIEKRIPNEFRVRNGAHTWSYWRTGIGPTLSFFGERFHK